MNTMPEHYNPDNIITYILEIWKDGTPKLPKPFRKSYSVDRDHFVCDKCGRLWYLEKSGRRKKTVRYTDVIPKYGKKHKNCTLVCCLQLQIFMYNIFRIYI